MPTKRVLAPTPRSERGRLNAALLHSRYSTQQTTSAAHRAFMGKFEREVDPDNKLAPEERAKRAKHALTAHMIRLSMASRKARAERAAARKKGAKHG